MYVFGENKYVLYNISNKIVTVSLKFDSTIQTEGWKELVWNEQVKVRVDSTFAHFPGFPRFRGPVFSNVSLTLQPYEMTVVQAP